jgi:predicted MPP superfamily phosphohydrolase
MFFLFQLLSCVSSPSKTTSDPIPDSEESFRIVFLSDSHVIGPQYECCSESEGIDNESIMKTPERLQHVVDEINNMSPAPDLVFMMGDIVHDAYYSDTFDWYSQNPNAFTVAHDILSQLNMPFYPVFGNHDYHYRCNGSGHTKELSHELFQYFWNVQPNYNIEHKGWNFVVSNTQMGVTWDNQSEECDTSFGSFGQDQLLWIQEQIQSNPTVVMGHHMLPIIKESEDTNLDIEQIFQQYPNTMKGYFVGHTHRWIDFSQSYDFTHIVMGATRYDEDNFWLLEFYSDGQYKILDYEKSRLVTPCAEDWVYEEILDNLPYANDIQVENGDCE